MSAGELLIRSAQFDNGFPIGKPFTGFFLAPVNKSKEGVRSKASPDDQSADPVSDVEQPANTFNFGRHFKQNSRVESVEHSPLPHTLESEQGKSAATSGGCKQDKALTCVKSVPLLSTVPALRQYAGETTPFDNDNWSPLEAA